MATSNDVELAPGTGINPLIPVTRIEPGSNDQNDVQSPWAFGGELFDENGKVYRQDGPTNNNGNFPTLNLLGYDGRIYAPETIYSLGGYIRSPDAPGINYALGGMNRQQESPDPTLNQVAKKVTVMTKTKNGVKALLGY
jgi:hypothetical protein